MIFHEQVLELCVYAKGQAACCSCCGCCLKVREVRWAVDCGLWAVGCLSVFLH